MHRLPPDLADLWGRYAPLFAVIAAAAGVIGLGLFTVWCECGPLGLSR